MSCGGELPNQPDRAAVDLADPFLVERIGTLIAHRRLSLLTACVLVTVAGACV